MTTNHHARDDWADARTDEALRRELDALAGLGAAASRLDAGLEDGLDGALGSVRRRIRRRRTVKQAGLGVTTLAVAGALAAGGAALLPDAPAPLPGPAVTPSPTEEPTPEDTGRVPEPDETGDERADATVDCSAGELGGGSPDLSALPDDVRDTATTLLDGALACDDDVLAARSAAHDTATNFGGRSPQEFWGLPGAEAHEDVYAILANVIVETGWATVPADDQSPAVYVWPRVATERWADDDDAWQEAVAAGALTTEEAELMRGAEGYMGWRVGILEDGTWQYFVGGD